MRARGGLVDGACVALSLAAALAVYWIAEGRIAGAASLSSFPLDDSWIHLHFARNLAEGAGFAYNPGVPVVGIDGAALDAAAGRHLLARRHCARLGQGAGHRRRARHRAR